MRSPCRVAAYVDLRYTQRPPTGVDKHIARLVRGLAARADFDVAVLASRAQLTPSGSIPHASSLAGLPASPLPFSNRTARMLWAVSPWPKADRWCPDADWIYSPQELWAPAARARTAVTLHGATYFERSYPGYGSAWARFERTRMAWFFRQVCSRADLVLPVSRHLETFLIDRFGLDPAKSLVIGNGIDDCFFAAGAAPPPADRNRLLVVGGLNDWDGAAHILAVADLLARDLPEITIDIAGTLDEPRYVAAAAARPNIRRLGYLPGDQLAAAMPGYLALLYLPNVESFGLAAVEAMAASLPVIACTSTAVPEIAGDAALSVDAHSPPAIVAAIRELRDSPASRAAWISRGTSRAAAFTWPACVDRLAQRLV
jgi:glycosyltransferase involved in cell wall biosynthesis